VGIGEKPVSRSAADRALAEVLLDSSSRTQYLLARLQGRDERWESITNGALMRLGRRYGARLVTEAVSYAKESGAAPDSPYPYLEAICADLERTRR